MPTAERFAGRDVVLAPLDEDCLVDGELHAGIRQRLLRIRELPSRAVATLLGVREINGHAWLVWEDVRGPTLEMLLGDPSTPAAVLRNTLDELRRAVQSLHQLGLVHGDLRTENVVLARGRVVLTRLSPLLHHDPRLDLEALRLIEIRANARLQTRDETSVTRVAAGVVPGVSPGVVPGVSPSVVPGVSPGVAAGVVPGVVPDDLPVGTGNDPDAPDDSSRGWLGVVAVLALGGLLSLTAWWLTRSGA